MKRVSTWLLAAGGAMVLAACAPSTDTADTPAPAGGAPQAGGAAAPAAGAPVNVYAGVYTTEQADRGQAIQRRVCSSCHSTGDWSQGRILGGWQGASAFELVSHIRNTMPLNAPGSLSLQEYTDIVAFMLSLNNIPAGSSELPADETALRNIELEYRR